MNQSNPSEKILWKILESPVSQLLRGRITGKQSLIKRIDISPISENVAVAIDEIITRLPRLLTSKITRQLVKACKEQLKKGQSEKQILEQLSDSENIAALIRKFRTADWVLDSPIPSRLWPTINNIVGQKKGFGRRRKKIAKGREKFDTACRSFQGQLEAGLSPEEIAEKYGDAISIGELINETRSPGLLLDHELPKKIVSLVLDVVKRTRLWPTEKSDTARELFAHFTDGLEKGKNADQLIKEFGSPKRSAKLIRRACLRKRPLVWQIWRRTWQSTAALFSFVLVVWVILFARFIVAEPTITFDMVQEYDDLSRAIPVEKRAWPLYREGMLKLSKEDRAAIRFSDGIELGLNDGPENKHWPEAKNYLAKNKASVELFLTASTYPQLGFINRDPENNEWFEWQGLGPDYQLNSFDKQKIDAIETMLPATQELGAIVLRMLNGEIYLAAEKNDGDRCLRILLAKLAISKHYRQTWSCPLTQIGFNQISIVTANLAVKLMLNQPELFTDDQLVTFFREFEALEIRDPDFKENLRGIEDFLQKTYTDDGKGNGRFTSFGCQFTEKMGSIYRQKGQNWMPSIFPAGSENEFLSAPVASMIADRKELRKELLLLNQLLWEKRINDTDAEHMEDSKFRIEYRRLMDSPRLRMKFLPALIYIYADQDDLTCPL
jgi:uncharacterized membrane protein